jgi:sigma-B regulation protein RsbU (phosphoserine phosphatase)
MDDNSFSRPGSNGPDTAASYLEDIILKRKELLSDAEMSELLELEQGMWLAKLFSYEWEVCKLKAVVAGQEYEHGRSLAILFEYESQKLQLEELNRKLSDAAVIHEKDMKMAEQVQRNLLCQTAPDVKNYEIAFHFEPQSSVSGDFYDFYIEDKNMLKGVALGDVSGHGIASGLLTVLTKPLFFRTFSKYHDQPVDKIVENINTNLINQIRGSEYYLTAVMLRFKGNNVEYVNAAHPDILLKRRSTGLCDLVKPGDKPMQGAILGIEAITTEYEQYTFTVMSGDVLLLYSDCLIEGKDRNGREFGMEHAAQILTRCPDGASAAEILKTLLTEFKKHIRHTGLTDDLSIIILKKK